MVKLNKEVWERFWFKVTISSAGDGVYEIGLVLQVFEKASIPEPITITAPQRTRNKTMTT